MTFGERCIQLPDGEELVVVDSTEWEHEDPRPDPREASLDHRRQAVQVTTPPPVPTATNH
jgi:hypothetical protein